MDFMNARLQPRIVQTIDDLVALRDHRGWRVPRHPIFLRLNTADFSKANEWEESLNKLREECGCGMGAACSLIAFCIAAFGVLAVAPVLSFAVVVKALAMGFGGLIIFGGIGKLFGLKLAQHRFTKTCQRILDQLNVD